MAKKQQVLNSFRLVPAGDALGLPVEMKTINEIRDIRAAENCGDDVFLSGGYDAFENKPAGTTSDDWQLTKATAEALTFGVGLDMNRQASNFILAYQDKTDGWGGSTISAAERLLHGDTWRTSGVTEDPTRGGGNGVLMKMTPFAVWLDREIEQVYAKHPGHGTFVMSDIFDFTCMTHNSSIAVEASSALFWAMKYVMHLKPGHFNPSEFLKTASEGASNGYVYYTDKSYIYFGEMHERLCEMAKLFSEDREKFREALYAHRFGNGKPYVLDSLPVALGLYALNPFSIQSLVDAANFGGDTDTNAAIVGSLLGFTIKTEDIPEHMIDEVLVKDEVTKTAENFCQALGITD